MNLIPRSILHSSIRNTATKTFNAQLARRFLNTPSSARTPQTSQQRLPTSHPYHPTWTRLVNTKTDSINMSGNDQDKAQNSKAQREIKEKCFIVGELRAREGRHRCLVPNLTFALI